MYTPKPEWLRVKHPPGETGRQVESLLKALGLNTVCRQALCPNYLECFGRKTATFMVLGIHCTRNCRFCNVTFSAPQPVNPDEPGNIGEAVRQLGLKYVVVTSVTRDDLPDGGAAHFAAVIRAVREKSPETAIEVLIPDLGGNLSALRLITNAAPAVVSHNMETVPRLYAAVRPQADYARSLAIIKNIKQTQQAHQRSVATADTETPTGGIHAKSGIMLGLGETQAEVLAVLGDLREAGCDFLTIGQYLAPSKAHYPVAAYVHPDVFAQYAETAKNMGFSHVASGPLVRSSYHADEAFT